MEALMKLFVFLIVAAIVVTPGAQAFAQQAQTEKSNAASRANASVPMSRDEAIQKCNAEAAKFSSRDFQSTNLTVYRRCMARHGQSSE
jgi:hypothetical protein